MEDEDEEELDKLVKKARPVAKKLGWAVAALANPHPTLIGMRKNPHKADFWVPYQLVRLHPDNNFVTANKAKLETVCQTYAVNDAVRTAGLYILFQNSLSAKQKEQVELHLAYLPVIRAVQSRGLGILKDGLMKSEAQLVKLRHAITKKLQTIAEDAEFLPTSQKQLSKALYTKLNAPVHKTTKTGPSTDKETLFAIKSSTEPGSAVNTFVSDVLHLRKVSTALGYLSSYKALEINGRLYPSIHPHGTKTTRVSSSDPNLQNVSKQDDKELADTNEETGINLRGIFGPSKDYTWYAMDYDQLQLRIFAYAAGSSRLIEQFEAGYDFHTYVASKLFDTKEPTTIQRRAAKYVNFGIIFGAGESRIDHMTGIPGAYRAFSRQFPEVPKFIHRCIQQVERHGFVETMGGYRLHVPLELAYKGANMVVQGTEGEMVKEAMLRCERYLNHVNQKGVSLLMQVHDELLFEFPINRVGNNHTLKVLSGLMEDAGTELGMKTPVGVKHHPRTWATGTELEI
jgi:DNA polymerase-1